MHQVLGLLRPAVAWRLGLQPRLTGLLGGAPARIAASAIDEFRHGARSVRRNGRVSLAAILILGLGIGAATTLFAVLDGVLLAPLPHPESDRLVRLTSRVLDGETIAAWRDEDDLFDGLAGFSIRGPTVRAGGTVERIRSMPVTADFLPLLAHGAVDGRLLRPSDHDPSAPRAVVVRRTFWERHFGPAWAPGRTIDIDGTTHTVVGTLPASFQFGLYRDVDAWHPFVDRAAPMSAVARLAPGVEPGRAARELERLAALRARERGVELPPEAPVLRLVRLHDATVGDVRTILWLLFGTTGLVLLLSCANAANLFLARLLERREELAVRGALGAGPIRILGQLLGEGAILAVLGAGLGIGLSAGAVAVLSGTAAESLPRGSEIAVDGRVLAFSILVSSLTVLAFALGPAIGATRRSSSAPGARARGATGGRGAGRARSALVVLQVALALVLAVGTSLLVRTFVRLNPTDPGFAIDDRYVARIDLPRNAYGDETRVRSFVRTLVRELEANPEIGQAAVIYFLPLSGLAHGHEVAAVDGRAPEDRAPFVFTRGTTAGLLELLEIPLIRGRGLADPPAGGMVTVVNETAARRFWPDGSALGRRLAFPIGPGGETLTYTVVGVAADTRISGSFTEDGPVAYVPYSTAPQPTFQVVLAATRGASVSRERIEAAIAAVDPEVPVVEYESMRTLIGRSVRLPRFQASVMSALGSLGLVVAVAGCFAVLTCLVAARRREMGIRVALGASRGRILTLVLGHGGLLVGTGLLLGIAACVASTRLLEGMLYGLSPLDPASYAIAIGVLALAAGGSILWPALRAAAVSPATALREE